MEITFDKEADAIYVEFSNGEFAFNKKIDEFTIVDFDKDGKILGIEILCVSKRMSSDFLSNISVRNLV